MLLLSLMLFVVLASSFSLDRNLPLSPSGSEGAHATTSVEHGAEQQGEETAGATVTGPAPQPDPAPAPTPAPAPAPSLPAPQPAPSFQDELESEVLRLTNIERAKAGLGELASNVTLAATSRAHSADMLARDFFSHDNPDGCSSSCRATEAGYTWQTVGENIYMMSGWELSEEEAAIMVVNGWMSSPGHRENILKNAYTESGVGIAQKGDTVYATALYGRPR